MGPESQAKTLDSFDSAYQPLAYRAACAFASAPEEKWLVLLGSVGCGKSHLLAACCNALLAAGRQPLYWCCPDLWQHFHEGYQQGDFSTRLAAVRDADVLLLDDFGADSDTDDRAEKLFMILNYRLDHRKTVAISANLDPQTMPPRIKSRLLAAQLVMAVKLEPYDYRTGERGQR